MIPKNLQVVLKRGSPWWRVYFTFSKIPLSRLCERNLNNKRSVFDGYPWQQCRMPVSSCMQSFWRVQVEARCYKNHHLLLLCISCFLILNFFSSLHFSNLRCGNIIRMLWTEVVKYVTMFWTLCLLSSRTWRCCPLCWSFIPWCALYPAPLSTALKLSRYTMTGLTVASAGNPV